MSGPVRYVPTPAVLIPLVLLGLAVTAWRLRRGGRFSWPRAAVGVLACVYGALLIKAVLLPLPTPGHAASRGVPWHAFLNLTPLVNTDFGDDMLLNVVLFLPLGILLPLLARVRSYRLGTLIGILVSLGIETAQLVTDVTLGAGHAADVNDLLANTVGAAAGFALISLAVRLPSLGRLAAVLTWPAPDGPT